MDNLEGRSQLLSCHKAPPFGAKCGAKRLGLPNPALMQKQARGKNVFQQVEVLFREDYAIFFTFTFQIKILSK